MVRSMVFIGSVLYIVGLLLTDISYTLVDPRIRLRIACRSVASPLMRWSGCCVAAAVGSRAATAAASRTSPRRGRACSPAGRRSPRWSCCPVYLVDRPARFAALPAGARGQGRRRARPYSTRGAVGARRRAGAAARAPREDLFGAARDAPLRQGDRSSCRTASRCADFPRLRYGGAHLKDEADCAARHRRQRIGLGLLGCRGRVFAAGRCRRAARLQRRRPSVPWRAARRRARACIARAGAAGRCAARARLPRARHRQGRAGRALPGAEVASAPAWSSARSPRWCCCRSASRSASWRATSSGWVDDVIQYVYTTLNSIPGVLLIAAVGADDAGRHRPATRTGSRPRRSAPTSACSCCARSSG